MAKSNNETAPEVYVEVTQDGATYKAKITMATINASPARAKKELENKRVEVATIIGVLSGVKEVPNKMEPERGPFIALTGNFEAINLHTGEVFRSGVCYLPGGLHELVISMLDELSGDDERSKFDKAAVQFALQIDAEPANNASGYQYAGKSLLPPAKADLLSELRGTAYKLLPSAMRQKLLPAPVAEAA